MTPSILSRRQFLTPPEVEHDDSQHRGRLPAPLRMRPALRLALLGGSALCWLAFLSPTIDTTAADGARTFLFGLDGSPWLAIQLGGDRSPSGLEAHALSASWLLALAGWVLFRAYRRPRVLAALRRLAREMFGSRKPRR
jgi:hypothetical protein